MTEITQQTPTFNELCEREPELLALWFEAASDPTTDTLGAWYGIGGYKQRLCELIGWDREVSSTDPILYSEEGYTVAYHEILRQLER